MNKKYDPSKQSNMYILDEDPFHGLYFECYIISGSGAPTHHPPVITCGCIYTHMHGTHIKTFVS